MFFIFFIFFYYFCFYLEAYFLFLFCFFSYILFLVSYLIGVGVKFLMWLFLRVYVVWPFFFFLEIFIFFFRLIFGGTREVFDVVFYGSWDDVSNTAKIRTYKNTINIFKASVLGWRFRLRLKRIFLVFVCLIFFCWCFTVKNLFYDIFIVLPFVLVKVIDFFFFFFPKFVLTFFLFCYQQIVTKGLLYVGKILLIDFFNIVVVFFFFFKSLFIKIFSVWFMGFFNGLSFDIFFNLSGSKFVSLCYVLFLKSWSIVFYQFYNFGYSALGALLMWFNTYTVQDFTLSSSYFLVDGSRFIGIFFFNLYNDFIGWYNQHNVLLFNFCSFIGYLVMVIFFIYLFYFIYVIYIMVYLKIKYPFFGFIFKKYGFFRYYNFSQVFLFFFGIWVCYFFNFISVVIKFFRVFVIFEFLLFLGRFMNDKFGTSSNDSMFLRLNYDFINFVLFEVGDTLTNYFLENDKKKENVQVNKVKTSVRTDLLYFFTKIDKRFFMEINTDAVFRYLFRGVFFNRKIINLHFSSFGINLLKVAPLRQKYTEDATYRDFSVGDFYSYPGQLLMGSFLLKYQWGIGKGKFFEYIKQNRWLLFYEYRLHYLKKMRVKHGDELKNSKISPESNESRIPRFVFSNPVFLYLSDYLSSFKKRQSKELFRNVSDYSYFYFHFRQIFFEPINEFFFYSSKVLQYFAIFDKKFTASIFSDYYELDVDLDLFKSLKGVVWKKKVVSDKKFDIIKEYLYRKRKVEDKLLERVILSYLSNYLVYTLRLIFLQRHLYVRYNKILSRKYFIGPVIIFRLRYSLFGLFFKKIYEIFFFGVFANEMFLFKLGSERIFFGIFKFGIVSVDLLGPVKFMYFFFFWPFKIFYDVMYNGFFKDLFGEYKDFLVDEISVDDLNNSFADEDLEDIEELYGETLSLFDRMFLRLSTFYDVESGLDPEDEFLFDVYIGNATHDGDGLGDATEALLLKTHGSNGVLYDSGSKYLEKDGLITPFVFTNNALIQIYLISFFMIRDAFFVFLQRVFYIIFFNKVVTSICKFIRALFFFFIFFYVMFLYLACIFWSGLLQIGWWFFYFIYFWSFSVLQFCGWYFIYFVDFVAIKFNNLITRFVNFSDKYYVIDIILVINLCPFLILRLKFIRLFLDLCVEAWMVFFKFFNKIFFRFFFKFKGFWLLVFKYFVIFNKFVFWVLFRFFLFYIVFYFSLLHYDNLYDYISLQFNFNFSFRTFFLLYMVFFFLGVVFIIGPTTRVGCWLWAVRYDYLFVLFVLWVLSAYIVTIELLFLDYWGTLNAHNRIYGSLFYDNLMFYLEDVGENSGYLLSNIFGHTFMYTFYEENIDYYGLSYLYKYGFFDNKAVKFVETLSYYNNVDLLNRYCLNGLVYKPDLLFSRELNNFYKLLYMRTEFKDITMALWFDYQHKSDYFLENFAFKTTVAGWPETFYNESEIYGYNDRMDPIGKDRESNTIYYPYFLKALPKLDLRFTGIRDNIHGGISAVNYMRLRPYHYGIYLPDFSFLGSEAWCRHVSIMQKDPNYLVDSLFLDDDESFEETHEENM